MYDIFKAPAVSSIKHFTLVVITDVQRQVFPPETAIMAESYIL